VVIHGSLFESHIFTIIVFSQDQAGQAHDTPQTVYILPHLNPLVSFTIHFVVFYFVFICETILKLLFYCIGHT